MQHSKIYRWIYTLMYRLKIVPLILKIVKWLVMTVIYPSAYRRAARRPLNPKKVVFVEVRESVLTDNYQLLYRALKRRGFRIRVCFLHYMTQADRAYIRRCVAMLSVIGDAKYVFLDDACEPLCRVKMRPETVVTQVWHACGAFKKWGMSTADLIFGATGKEQLRYGAYKNLDYVTVSSPEVVWAYEEAMNIRPETHIVRAVGVSRTDIFFQRHFQERARARVCDAFPACADKKIILFAPTFRGRTAMAEGVDKLDIRAFKAHFGGEYVLLIKQHPFVKSPPPVPEDCADFARDVTGELAIEDLLCVSDLCITDYSSLIFEYSLFERPMIFFAYDYEEYCDWRGFYYDYNDLTPGPVVRTNEEMIAYIHSLADGFDASRVRAFREKFMSACDGHATERILDLVTHTRRHGDTGKIS